MREAIDADLAARVAPAFAAPSIVLTGEQWKRLADPAAVLDSTFGSLPNLGVPSRDEWDRA